MNAVDRSFLGHPRGLAFLAFTEAWERFSFYGMQTMLVLYMVGDLFRPERVGHVMGLVAVKSGLETVLGPLSMQSIASLIFGVYYGMAYLLPVFGGLIGDRYVGQHRMVMAGAIMMAIGHFLMAFDAPFLIALGLLILGSGCLKGNLSTQVGSLYAADDRRRTEAFQIFQLAITVGIILAPFVCGTLGELFGWHYGFGAAGIGMLIGLLIYIAGTRYLPSDRLVKSRLNVGRMPLDRDEWRRIGALVVILLVISCYMIPGGQAGIIYPLWIRTYVDRHAGGLTIPITWFQSFTAIASLIGPPLLMRYWRRQAERGREGDEIGKIAIGCTLCAIAYLILALVSIGRTGATISWLWLLLHHAIYGLSYLFLWPVGLALFTRAAPASMVAMFVGIFFLPVSVAGYVAGILGRFYETMSPAAFWGMQAAITTTGLIALLILMRPLRRIFGRAPTSSRTETV